MYAALDKNGTLVYAKTALMNQNYYCCHCDKKVKLILTETRKYFRHINKVDNDINERTVHVEGKNILHKAFVSMGYGVVDEVYLPKAKQRPDLLINQKLVIEYQCAKLNVHILEQRVNGYQQMGISSIWILGGTYLAPKVSREHLKFLNYDNELGFYLLMLDSSTKLLTIFHHIRFVGPFSKIYSQKIVLSEDNMNQVFEFHPPTTRLLAQSMNEKLLKQLRQKNDLISQRIKLEFYEKNKITVESFLADKSFLPQEPIYQHRAWQIACGANKDYLNQPLLKRLK